MSLYRKKTLAELAAEAEPAKPADIIQVPSKPRPKKKVAMPPAKKQRKKKFG